MPQIENETARTRNTRLKLAALTMTCKNGDFPWCGGVTDPVTTRETVSPHRFKLHQPCTRPTNSYLRHQLCQPLLYHFATTRSRLALPIAAPALSQPTCRPSRLASRPVRDAYVACTISRLEAIHILWPGRGGSTSPSSAGNRWRILLAAGHCHQHWLYSVKHGS